MTAIVVEKTQCRRMSRLSILYLSFFCETAAFFELEANNVSYIEYL